MADKPAGGEKAFGFLARKVGPFPVVVWGLIGAGGYLLWEHFHGSSSSSSTGAQQGSGTGGNINVKAILSGGGGGGGSTTPTPTPTSGSVTVPNVVGMDRANSALTLSRYGLLYKQKNKIRGAAHASAESPAAGAKVNAGSTVTVTMVKGAPTVKSALPPPSNYYTRANGNGTSRATSPATASQQESASAPSQVTSVQAQQAPEQVSGGNQPVVYEGPVYGLWTTQQDATNQLGGTGTSIDITQGAAGQQAAAASSGG